MMNIKNNMLQTILIFLLAFLFTGLQAQINEQKIEIDAYREAAHSSVEKLIKETGRKSSSDTLDRFNIVVSAYNNYNYWTCDFLTFACAYTGSFPNDQYFVAVDNSLKSYIIRFDSLDTINDLIQNNIGEIAGASDAYKIAEFITSTSIGVYSGSMMLIDNFNSDIPKLTDNIILKPKLLIENDKYHIVLFTYYPDINKENKEDRKPVLQRWDYIFDSEKLISLNIYDMIPSEVEEYN